MTRNLPTSPKSYHGSFQDCISGPVLWIYMPYSTDVETEVCALPNTLVLSNNAKITCRFSPSLG